MKEWIKNNIKYIVIILIIVTIMTFFMTKKEGYHEDEMFSYGSSNYTWDNVYRPYGKEDATNVLVRTKIAKGNLFNILKNVKYYVWDHRDETDSFLLEFDSNRKPIWRTSEEAKDYLTVEGNEVGNYFNVYYNQARDVHPPLFYFLVHTVSLFFYGTFSKYIIYSINIIFMIASLVTIKKIFEAIDKKHLIIPGLILYGCSMGAISTVILQRMYAMLTFFSLEFILINIKIAKNDFQIDKKTWIELGFITVLGFLTQYYFCILAVLIALMIFIGICREKDKKQILKYIFNYAKIAVIGIVIYPFAINHMFFSYRGVGEAKMQRGFIEKLIDYFNLVRIFI